MEIKIPKEVRQHKETIFFGLSVRQFACAVLAVSTAVGVYFLLKTITGPETASWACIVAAAPVAVTGFFQYNGMTFEQFLWAFLKSQFLCAGPRVFQSENLYGTALTKKGVQDYDQNPGRRQQERTGTVQNSPQCAAVHPHPAGIPGRHLADGPQSVQPDVAVCGHQLLRGIP